MAIDAGREPKQEVFMGTEASMPPLAMELKACHLLRDKCKQPCDLSDLWGLAPQGVNALGFRA